MPEIATSIRFGALCVASLLLLATAARAIGTTTGTRGPPGRLFVTSNRPLSTTIIGPRWDA